MKILFFGPSFGRNVPISEGLRSSTRSGVETTRKIIKNYGDICRESSKMSTWSKVIMGQRGSGNTKWRMTSRPVWRPLGTGRRVLRTILAPKPKYSKGCAHLWDLGLIPSERSSKIMGKLGALPFAKGEGVAKHSPSLEHWTLDSFLTLDIRDTCNSTTLELTHLLT